MPAPQRILDLVKTFAEHKDHYKSFDYNEAQLRQEFLNPFFKCLEWDMEHEAGHDQAYKDVVHEDAIKIEGANKAPDYSFRIGRDARS